MFGRYRCNHVSGFNSKEIRAEDDEQSNKGIEASGSKPTTQKKDRKFMSSWLEKLNPWNVILHFFGS